MLHFFYTFFSLENPMQFALKTIFSYFDILIFLVVVLYVEKNLCTKAYYHIYVLKKKNYRLYGYISFRKKNCLI